MTATVPPVGAELRVALDAAAEGGDHNETAFALLVDDVRAWPEVVAGSAAPADWAALVAGGDALRGEPLVVRGRLVQREGLESRWPEVEEWFIRDGDGRAICAFVVDPPTPIREGREVELLARWYKQIDAVARDGSLRSYPAVVGRLRDSTSTAGPSGGKILPYAGLAAVVLAMGIVYLLVRVRARRAARRPRSGAGRRGP